MTEWDAWIGNEERFRSTLEEEHAARWLATFNRTTAEAALSDGVMPQGIHFSLCQPAAKSESLGEDGHDERWDSLGSFLPPIPMPRRMWASGEITFHEPIKVGAKIARTRRVASIEERIGRSGEMIFVNVEHELRGDDRLCVEETQTLVFREAAERGAPLSPPEPGPDRFSMEGWDSARAIIPDQALLFRYSAITFNSHRIHYDAPYAREVERYRGPVVHGPLIASLLLQTAAGRGPVNSVRNFKFRACSPAIVGERLHLTSKNFSGKLGAFASDGREVMRAEAIHRSRD